MASSRLLGVLALLALVACDAPSEPLTLPYRQTDVAMLADEQGNWFILDTGMPRTLIEPAVLDEPAGSFVERDVPEWSFHGLNPGVAPLLVTDVFAEGVVLAQSQGRLAGLGGIVGADLLYRQPFALDARTSSVTFGGVRRETSQPAIDVPVERLGGGETCLAPDRCFDFGATRLVVPVNVDGYDTYALVDTGTPALTTTETVFARIYGENATTDESPGVALWRVRSVVVGGFETLDVSAAVVDELAVPLARLQVETSRRIEVILGLSLWLRYVTEIDAAEPRITLFPYDGP